MKSDAISSVILNSLSAMAVISIIAATGYLFAFYPKKEPYLCTSALKYASIISNNICLPALIISSLGSSLSINLLSRMGILLLFSFMTGVTSYTIGGTLGKFIDQDISNMFLPIYVAIGSPNIVSLPLIVLSTLCQQSMISSYFNGSQSQCFTEASSMVFVYSIGWHIIYWSYGYPILKTLNDDASLGPTTPLVTHSSLQQSQQSSTATKDSSNFIRPPLLRKKSLASMRESFRESLQLVFFDFQQHLYHPRRTRSSGHHFSSDSFILRSRSSHDDLMTASGNQTEDLKTTITHYCNRIKTVMLTPIMICIYIGTLIGLIQPHSFFYSVLPLLCMLWVALC